MVSRKKIPKYVTKTKDVVVFLKKNTNKKEIKKYVFLTLSVPIRDEEKNFTLFCGASKVFMKA